MNLEDYRTVFVSSWLVLILVALTPTLSLILPSRKGSEGFSEFWVLSSTHKTEDYPFSINVGKPYRLFVGISNHMGESSYYSVYVKFRNQTQPLPNATISLPSPLPILYGFRAFVLDTATWEKSLTFSVVDFSRFDNLSSTGRLTFDDQAVRVDSTAIWDSGNKGFYYQLFFELWLYDQSTRGFKFHNRFLMIWLNITD